MTAAQLSSAAARERHPNRLAKVWRCPDCALALVVIDTGRHVKFKYRGKQWKCCPGCRRRGLNHAYRAERKAAS